MSKLVWSRCLLSTVCATSAVFLSGCGGGGEETSGAGAVQIAPNETPPEGITPVINVETGVAVFGSRRYALPPDVDANVANASTWAMTDCLRSNGIDDQHNWTAASPEDAYDSNVGVWRLDEAELFAFSPPMDPRTQIVNGIQNSVASERAIADANLFVNDMGRRLEETRALVGTAEWDAAVADCNNDPLVAEWSERSLEDIPSLDGPWYEEFISSQEAAYQDARMATIRREFEQCLAPVGIEVEVSESSRWVGFFDIVGQDASRIDEEQIKLAVEVVRCKQETDAVERVLNVVAEYEASVYLEYEDELQETRRRIEELEAAADEFWTARG